MDLNSFFILNVQCFKHAMLNIVFYEEPGMLTIIYDICNAATVGKSFNVQGDELISELLGC